MGDLPDIGAGAHRTGGLGIAKIGKVLGKAQDRVIKHTPRHAAGLGQDLGGGLGITLVFIVEPIAPLVDLDAPLHHQTPRNQCALRHGPRAMPLVGAHVGQSGPHLLAPGNRAAVVAGVTGKHRVGHLGQPFAQHDGVAPKSIAGQDQGLARQIFHLAIGSGIAHPQRMALRVQPQLAHGGLGQHIHTLALRDVLQLGHQGGPRALRGGVHAQSRVTWVTKTGQHLHLQTQFHQAINGLRHGLRIGRHQVGGRITMGLGLDVFFKQRDGIFNALCTLHLRGRSRNKT